MCLTIQAINIIAQKRIKIYLLEFLSLDDAIVARLKAEVKYYKKFAPQKYLFEKYGINGDADEI